MIAEIRIMMPQTLHSERFFACTPAMPAMSMNTTQTTRLIWKTVASAKPADTEPKSTPVVSPAQELMPRMLSRFTPAQIRNRTLTTFRSVLRFI